MEIPQFTPANPLDLSADLRSQIGLWQLTTMAIEAVHKVKPGCSTFVHKGQFFSESMLLTVLTFCYAGAIYASSEVEAAIHEDEHVRYLSARVFPDSEDLRHFRRANAGLIKKCLTELFGLADNSCRGPENLFPTYAASSSELMFSASRNWLFTAEAERRVTLAIQADCIAMDA